MSKIRRWMFNRSRKRTRLPSLPTHQVLMLKSISQLLLSPLLLLLLLRKRFRISRKLICHSWVWFLILKCLAGKQTVSLHPVWEEEAAQPEYSAWVTKLRSDFGFPDLPTTMNVAGKDLEPRFQMPFLTRLYNDFKTVFSTPRAKEWWETWSLKLAKTSPQASPERMWFNKRHQRHPQRKVTKHLSSILTHE